MPAKLRGILVTLFVMWELTALAFAFLIWARRTGPFVLGRHAILDHLDRVGRSSLAGGDYSLSSNQSIAFNALGVGTIGTNLILLAFAVKRAFPLLHNWVQDSTGKRPSPERHFSPRSAIKPAIYALARGFPGTDMLFGSARRWPLFQCCSRSSKAIFRRVLAYGSQYATRIHGGSVLGSGRHRLWNGTAAHAFTGVLHLVALHVDGGAIVWT